MGILVQKLFHLICVKEYHQPDDYDEDYFRKGFDEAEKFFNRFDNKIEIRNKTVLDVGCGLGSTCIYMALRGAKKVVGIDTDQYRIDFARSKLATCYQELSNIVEFRSDYSPELKKFDIVLSKDSFEHYGDPSRLIVSMKEFMDRKGIMAIGFSPLWKSPYGGHIDFMTKVPWAHLFFPESVIMQERKRFRPDEDAQSFEQVVGGLNKMTLKGYLDIIGKSGLEVVYFKTNVSSSRIIVLFNTLRRIPNFREFFTINVYTIMRMKV